MVLKRALRLVPTYTAVGALIFASLITMLVQTSFGTGSDSYELSIPVSTVIREAPGTQTVVAEKALGDDLRGRTCTAQAKAVNQHSVHPGNNLVVSSPGGSGTLTLSDVERSPNAVTTTSGTITFGDSVIVTLVMGQDGAFSAGFSVDFNLECVERDVEVCRDGVPMTVKESDVLPSDTTPPCPVVVQCTSLVAHANSRTEYSFTATAEAKNGHVTSFTFEVDGQTKKVDASNNSATYVHTFATAGTYTVKARANYIDEAKEYKSAHCEDVVVVVEEKPTYDVSLKKYVLIGSDWKDANTHNHGYRFKPSDTVKWKVVVTNDLATTATGVVVTDVPPHAVEYVSNTAGATVESTGLVWNVGTLDGSSSKEMIITTTAKHVENKTVAVNWAAVTAMDQTDVDSVVRDAIDGNEDDEDPAVIVIKKPHKPQEKPTPVHVTCNSLTIIGQNTTSATVRAQASTSDDSAITSYTFYLNGDEVQSSSSESYVFNGQTPGTYTVTAVASNGEIVSDVGNCSVQIHISQPSVLACTGLSVVKLSRTEYSVKATSYTHGNASITTYLLKSGDTELGSSTSGAFTLKRSTPGPYEIQVYVVGQVDGEAKTVSSESCKAVIHIEEETTKPPVSSCDGLHVVQKSRNSFVLSPSISGGSGKMSYDYYVNGSLAQSGEKADFSWQADSAGSYSIKLVARVWHEDGSEAEVTCSTHITVTEEPAGVVLGKTTPDTLPNTGTGSTIGIAAASSLSAIFMGAHLTASKLYKRQFNE